MYPTPASVIPPPTALEKEEPEFAHEDLHRSRCVRGQHPVHGPRVVKGCRPGMSDRASDPTAVQPAAPKPVNPEPIPPMPIDPEKGRVPPVTVPGKSEHPKQ